MSTNKRVTGLATGIAVAAITVAVAAENPTHTSEGALAERAGGSGRLAQAEQRVADAASDGGDLLRAGGPRRDQQAAPAGEEVRVARSAGSPTQSSEEEARLAQLRSFQQELAKRRADEAKARAKIESDAAATKDPAERYHKLMAAAAEYAAKADFQAGIRTYNLGMQMKPADLPVTERIRQLQATLKAQNSPVELSLISDGLTMVSVTGPYGLRPPSPLETAKVKVLPANYEVIGRRKGYQDVVISVQVRNGVPAPVISVACTVPVAP